MTQKSLGRLTASSGIDRAGFQRDFQALKKEAQAAQLTLTVSVTLDNSSKQVLTDLKALQAAQASVSAQGVQGSRAQAAAAQALTQQHKAAGEAQVQAARVTAAQASAATAQLRQQAAQLTLTTRLATQAAQASDQQSRQSINALSNEQRAYHNLWTARKISDDQLLEAQRRIHAQALQQAAAVDQTSDAYRRLTQVAAGAQRSIDKAQGVNTPGGFAASVQQGLLGALGNLGPFGALLEQVVTNGMVAAQAAAREGAQHVAAQAGAGLRTGLAAQAPTAQAAGANLGQQVQQGAQTALDIRSPSRVMQQVGVQAGQGLVNGLNSQRAAVTTAAAGLGQAVQQGAAAAATVSGGGTGGTASTASTAALAAMPSAQASLRGVATQAALTTLAVGGTALALGVLGTGMVNGAKKAAEYEQGLAEISVLTDKLPGQLGQLGTDLLKMSVDVAKPFTELKKAYEEIQGASVKGTDNEADALAALERMATLAKVTKVEAQVSADAVTSLLNAYGMDITQTARVSDLLWTSVKAGKVQLGEIARSLGAVAGQAKGLDVPIEQLLGAMAMLTTRGIPASTALEYIRSALVNVQKPSIDAKATARELSIEFSATALKSMGLIKFLDQLGRGVGDNSEALSRLIGDVGGLQAVMGLLQGGLSDNNTIMQQLTSSTGQLDAAAAKLKGSAVDSINRFNASWDRTQILFSGGLLNSFTNFLDKGVNPVLKSVGDLQAKLNGLKDTGEIKTTLKIDLAKDDATTVIFKFLAGAVQGTKEIAGAAAEGLAQDAKRIIDPISSAVSGLVARMKAEDLQGELQSRGLIARPTSVGAAASQLKQIQGDMPGYQALLLQALNRSSQASEAILQSVGMGRTAGPNVLAAGVQGPLAPGQTRGAASAWSSQFIGSLKDVFVSDPNVSSDCAIIASRIMRALGVQIEEEANAGALAKAVKKVSKQVTLADAKPGDYIDFAGPGFGQVSGHHSGVVVGRDKNGNLQYINNHGYGSRPGTDVPTTIDTFDAAYVAKRGTATFYRPDASPYAQGGASQPTPTSPDPDDALKAALAKGKSLIAQYKLALASGNEIWQSKAYMALEDFKRGHKEVLGGLKDDLASLDRDLAARERAAAQRRASARATLEGQLDRQLAAGKLDKAQATAGKMQQQLDTELAKYKNDAAGRLRVEEELGPKVLAAQKRVLEAQRDQAVTAAENTAQQQRAALTKTYGKGKEPKDLLAGIASGERTAVEVANSTFATKIEALYSASTERINSATAAVQAKDKQAAANRLQTQQALTSALAEGREDDARRALDDLKSQQQTELNLYKDDAGKRAEVVERTGPEILAAEDRLAKVRRDRRVAQAQLDADTAKKLPGADLAAIERTRLEVVRQADADMAADREKARQQQADAERVADAAAEEAAKQVRANRLAAERALTDGRIDLAQKAAQAVVTGYDDAMKAAGDSAREQLAVEERLGRDLLVARNVLSTSAAETERNRLERERNAAVNVTGLTLKTRQDLWRQYNTRIAQVDSDLQATLVRNGQESARTLDAAWSKLFSQDDADRARAYAEKVRTVLDSIPGQDEDGLIRIYTEAQAFRDTQVMDAVFAELEKRREAEEAGLRALQQAASDGVADDALKLSGQLAELGDDQGAMDALSVALGQVMDAAQRGEDAAGAVDTLIAAMNRLGETTAENDSFNEFVAGLSGTIDEQIMQVMDRFAGESDMKIKARLQALLATLRQSLPDFGNPYAAGLIPGANGFQTSGDAAGGRAVLDATSLAQRLGAAGTGAGDGVTTDPDGTVVVRVRVEDEGALNAAMLEAANLLGSEAGQALPESVRAGLQAALDGAQAYKDALASITGEAVADGASEALKNAPQPPKNFFDASAQQIFSMQASGDLADPAKVQALRQALQTLRETGSLTDDQLTTLNATIDQFTSSDFGTMELGKRFDLGQWQKDIQELGEQFDSGEIDAKTFTDRLALAGDKLREYADEADAAGNPKLAAAFRAQAAELRAMSPQIAGVMNRLGKVVEYADYVQQAAGAFGKLTGAIGESEQEYDSLTGKKLETPWKDLTANLEGVANAAGKVMELVTDVMKVVANPADIGAWVKLITNVVSSIADAIAGFAKARAEVQRLKSDFQEANPLLNGADYQNSYTRSRGLFADIFGGGPEVVNEIDKVGLPIAQSIAGAITSGITSGFDAYAQSGNIEDFAKAMNAELTKGIKDALVQGFLDDPQRKNDYAAVIKQFTDAWKTHDPAQIMAAAQGIYAQTQATAAAARDLAEQMDALDRLNGTGRYSPEALAQQARDLASQALGVEEQQLERLHTKGLISTTEYENRKLALALRRIEIERQTALAAAGLTAEQILLINQQFDEAAGLAQDELDAQRLEKAKQFAKDLQGLTMNNAETALGIEEKLATSLATTEDEKYQVQRTYAARRLALTLDRLAVEEAAEKALVDMSLEGAQAMIAAISEKYRLARESAGTEVTLLERSYAAQQEAARQSALNTFTNQLTSTGVSAFVEGLEKSDFSTFMKKWRTDFAQATMQGIIEAEIGRTVTAQLLPLAERYRLALGTAGTADDLAALADLRSGVTTAATGLQPFFEGLQPLWADLKNELAENTAATKDNTEATKQQQFYATTVDASTSPPPTRSAALQGRLTR